MSSSGFSWGAWQYAKVSESDVNGTALADGSQLTIDNIPLDGYASAEFIVTAVEDDTGVCDGDIYAYVCGGEDGGSYETIDDDPLQADSVAMVQDTTRRMRFSVDPAEYGDCKILIDNDCGQEVAVTIRYRLATFDTT